MGLLEARAKETRTYPTPYSIAEDVIGFRILFVNFYTIGEPGKGNSWWLIDAGLPGSANTIIREVETLYGEDNAPEGIILTHGHFDHVGALPRLIVKWPGVRIYAHPKEMPFLRGNLPFPPPDPGVGGMMSRMSWMFPRKPVEMHVTIHPLSEGTEIPGLPDWRVIDTPGHSPGQIALFRESDRRLIAGDAFVTTNQNYAYSTLTQKRELHAPPAYFTINWMDAKKSFEKLTDLEPEAAGTGHGYPFFGEMLRTGLRRVRNNFELEEVPLEGHYTRHPVHDMDLEAGSVEIPKSYQRSVALGAATLIASVTALAVWMIGKGRKRLVTRERKKEPSEFD